MARKKTPKATQDAQNLLKKIRNLKAEIEAIENKNWLNPQNKIDAKRELHKQNKLRDNQSLEWYLEKLQGDYKYQAKILGSKYVLKNPGGGSSYVGGIVSKDKYSTTGGKEYKFNPDYDEAYNPNTEEQLEKELRYETPADLARGNMTSGEMALAQKASPNVAKTNTPLDDNDVADRREEAVFRNSSSVEQAIRTHAENEARTPNKESIGIPQNYQSDVFSIDPTTGQAVGVMGKSQRAAFENRIKLMAKKGSLPTGYFNPAPRAYYKKNKKDILRIGQG